MNTHGPPLKRESAPAGAQIPKLTELPEDKSGHSVVQPCRRQGSLHVSFHAYRTPWSRVETADENKRRTQ